MDYGNYRADHYQCSDRLLPVLWVFGGAVGDGHVLLPIRLRANRGREGVEGSGPGLGGRLPDLGFLPEAVPADFHHHHDSLPNPVEPEHVDESSVQRHGRLGHLGDRERRTEANNRVHRECDHDGAVFSSSDVDIRRKDRE